MKRIIPALLALGMLFTAVPAFACDGHGGEKAEGGDTLMTSVEDGKKADAKDAKKAKAKKDAKKKGDKKATETTDGEV